MAHSKGRSKNTTSAGASKPVDGWTSHSRSAIRVSKVSPQSNFAERSTCSHLCEGSACRGGRKSKKGGRGRIQVLQRRGKLWHPVARIKLPRHVKFKDYAGLAFRSGRLAVVSQESSRVWVGRLRPGEWTVEGQGRFTTFRGQRKARSSTAPWKGSRGRLRGRSLRCPIYARSGIRSAARRPISRSTLFSLAVVVGYHLPANQAVRMR